MTRYLKPFGAIHRNCRWATFINKRHFVKGELVVLPNGGELFKHMHDVPERYQVLSGRGLLTLTPHHGPDTSTRTVVLKRGVSVDIPAWVYHHTVNLDVTPLRVLYSFRWGPMHRIRYIS